MFRGTFVNQYSITEQKVVKKFGQVHFPFEITAIATVKILDSESKFESLKIFEDPDKEFQFTASANGNLKQWLIKTGELKKDWGDIHNSSSIDIIKSTSNGQYIITADKAGFLKMWSLKHQT